MKIPKLKPNSPDFDNGEETFFTEPERLCDHDGCYSEGAYKAPKSATDLNEYYFFCLEHIQDYNKNWNFFQDFSDEELESYIKQAHLWDRPTWHSGIHPMMEEKLKARLFDFFEEEDLANTKFKHFKKDEDGNNTREENFESEQVTAEMKALDVLGIKPPTDIRQIKKRYKELVKKYHPDLNREDETAEEKIKQINAAFTVLKIAFEKYDKIKQ